MQRAEFFAEICADFTQNFEKLDKKYTEKFSLSRGKQNTSFKRPLSK